MAVEAVEEVVVVMEVATVVMAKTAEMTAKAMVTKGNMNMAQVVVVEVPMKKRTIYVLIRNN